MDPHRLRDNGIYAWRGREYQVIHLGAQWRAVGLMGHPFGGRGADINYVRPDGSIVDVMFAVIGRAEELVDTGRTVEVADATA